MINTKVRVAREKLIEMREKLNEAQTNYAMVYSDPKASHTKIERARIKSDKLKEKIKAQQFRVNTLALALRKEQMVKMQESIEQAEVKLTAEALENNDSKTLKALVVAAEKIVNYKAGRKEFNSQIGALEDYLRLIVGENPTGWTADKDINKRYKYLRAGRFLIKLEDSPTYSIELTDLVNWLGTEMAMKFVKVDVSALVKAIENPELETLNVAGETITFDDWLAKRQRTVGKPKVKIVEVDAPGSKSVLVVHNELLGATIESLLESTALTGNEINPLLFAGITLVAQLRGLSGEVLTSIMGIGPVRAARIINEVTKLSVEE